MNLIFYLMQFMFVMSCLLFTFKYKHLLLTLISLEFIVVNTLYSIYFMSLMFKTNLLFISIFLSLAVCESVVSLCLLIFFVRFSGNDYLNNLNLMKW